jgi:putative membrane protein
MTDKEELAEARTDWAEDRTVLANERTFAGWMRTGMTAVAIALGLQALFRAFEPTWVPKAVATGFVLVAIFVFLSAGREARATLRRMRSHDARPRSSRSMTLISVALSLASAATGTILWVL